MAGGLTLGRFAIRGYNSRRLYWDDLAHLAAFLVLLSHSATNEVTLNAKADLALLKSAKTTPQATLLHSYQHVHYLNTVNNCLLYLVFWLVKVSFLLFYHQLFGTSVLFKKIWWAVLAFTLVTFWVPIAGVIATCANAKNVADYSEQLEKDIYITMWKLICTTEVCDGATASRLVKLEYTCVINVVSDLASKCIVALPSRSLIIPVMALPLWMLKDLKIRTRQKVGLAFIFSLAIFIVALDILRTVEAASENQALFTVLEVNFAVIVSCLPTYRALLAIGQKRTTNKASKITSYARKSLGNGRSRRDDDGRLPLRSQEDIGTEMHTQSTHDSKGFAVPTGERDPYSIEALDDHHWEFNAPASAHFQRPAFSPSYSNRV